MADNLIGKRSNRQTASAKWSSLAARQKQIKLYVNPDRLRAYNLSVTQVTNAVTAQNQELPGGTLVEGQKRSVFAP